MYVPFFCKFSLHDWIGKMTPFMHCHQYHITSFATHHIIGRGTFLVSFHFYEFSFRGENEESGELQV